MAPDEDDDDLNPWCAGYVTGSELDETWKSDEQGRVFTLPLAILSGAFPIIGQMDADGKVIEDPAPQLQRCRAQLDGAVQGAHDYWAAWRREHLGPPVAARSAKVGRNEPCPCVSGRKYKKCCALAD